MRKLLIAALVALAPLFATAQTYTAQYSKQEWKAARKWVASGVWRNGFTKASPDKTVNFVDFQRQYERNPEQWNALFRWLAETDLHVLPKGKHPIPGTTMTASVQDDVNSPLEKRGSESHRKKIDFQYVVSGTEGFAVLEHETSTPNCEYNAKKDVIHYDYDAGRLRRFTNRDGRFNIFFPSDWHIAKLQVAKKNKPFRVIVVKVDYKD